MIVYGNVLPLIAANMLGVDETPSESQQDDALGEIINVICGNMLPNISSPEAVFDVGIPQFLEVTDSPSQKSDLFVTAELGIDRGRAGLFLFLERNTLP